MKTQNNLPWKVINKLLLIFALIIIIVSNTGCSGCSKSSKSSSKIEINSIEITADSSQIALNTHLQFYATAFTKNGDRLDFSEIVSWSSSNENLATISEQGLVKALDPGEVTISATSNKLTVDFTLTISPAKLKTINISPAPQNILIDQSRQLNAIGIYDDGTKQDISKSINWTVTNDKVLVVNNSSITGIKAGTTELTANLDSIEETINITVIESDLPISIYFSVPEALFLGDTLDLNKKIVTGFLSDGDDVVLTGKVQWNITSSDVASINNDIITLNQLGDFSLTATYNNISFTRSLIVQNPSLESIKITPLSSAVFENDRIQLKVEGFYTNNAIKNLTNEVIWSSENPSIISVSNAINREGILLGLSTGFSTITATLGGYTDTLEIEVVNAELSDIEINLKPVTLSKSTYVNLTAIGIYSDNTRKDVTKEVSWSSDNSSIVTIDNAATISGRAFAKSVGSAKITAQLNDKSDATQITVNESTLVELIIEPNNLELYPNAKQQLNAIGVFSDGSKQNLNSQVIWQSWDTSIALVSNLIGSEGLINCLRAGQTTISASLNNLTSTTTLNSVDKQIVKIILEADSTQLAKGTQLNINAIALFSDNSSAAIMHDIIYESSDDFGLRVSNATNSLGKIFGHIPGIYTVSAFSHNINAQPINITVTDATLGRIDISPKNQTLPIDTKLNLTATGIFSDNTQQNLTSQVIWKSNNASAAHVSNAENFSGQLTTFFEGNVEISATTSIQSEIPISGKLSISVVQSTIKNIQLTAENRDTLIPLGFSNKITATGNFSDSTTRDITHQADWQSLSPDICTFSDVTNNPGIVSTRAIGECRVSATLGSQSNIFAFDVTNAQLTSIKFSKENITLPIGFSEKLIVLGTFSDDSQRDITSEVILLTDNTDVININNKTASVKALSNGEAIVTTNYDELHTEINISTTDATLNFITLEADLSLFYKGRFNKITATATFSDNSTQDISDQVLWSTNDESVLFIDNIDNPGLSYARDHGDVTITAKYDNFSGSLQINIVSDPSIPVSLSLNADPSVILNDGSDTTTITINVQAADQSIKVPDTTEIKISIYSRNSEGVIDVEDLTLTTENGIASFAHNSTNSGLTYIVATIPNSFIGRYIAIYSTDDMANMIYRVGVSIDMSLNVDNELVSSSIFGVYIKNLSNRNFNLKSFSFNLSVPVTPSDTSLKRLEELSLDPKLRPNEEVYLVFRSEADIENALEARFILNAEGENSDITIPISLIVPSN